MTSSWPSSTDATSKRISPAGDGLSCSQRAARARIRCCFWRVTASAGTPKAFEVRVLTSQNTTVRPRRTTRSSSPSRQRQFRSTTW